MGNPWTEEEKKVVAEMYADYFAEASAIKNSIGGIFGFVGSLLAGKLLALIQYNGNMLFGINHNNFFIELFCYFASNGRPTETTSDD
jgi:uncharacterized membrane protein YesL